MPGVIIAFSLPIKAFFVLLLGVIPIKVTTTDGQKLEGDFGGIQPEGLLVSSDGGDLTVPFTQLLTLTPKNSPDGTGPMMHVTLASDTVIAAETVTVANEVMTIEPRLQAMLSIPVQHIRAVRFHPPKPASDAQWFSKIEDSRRGDTLVIRREADRLDFIEGIVNFITAEKVGIEIDGDLIEAPIERLEGVIFGGTKPVANPAAVQIVDAWGSRWYATELRNSVAEGPLSLKLSGSIEHAIPTEQIQSIRWAGSLSMLASVAPASTSQKEFLETKLSSSLLDAWFRPKPDGAEDLLLYGDSSIDFRIDEGFKTFAAGVRRDGLAGQASKVSVRVLLDEKVIWQQSFDGVKDQVHGFELAIEQGRRLRLEVDTGDDGDLGDTIRFLRPRLLR